MNRILNSLFFPKKPKDSLITVHISKANLLHNLQEFHAINGTIAPVLKSNAYGHGLLQIARILETASVPFFVVDSYYEAHTLRYNGITKPLLVIGYTQPDIIKTNKLKDVSFVITSMDTLEAISDTAQLTSIHLKIDTGMHRQGIMPDELGMAMSIVKNKNALVLQGLCTHFSDADNTDDAYTKGQIKLWNSLVEKAKETFGTIKFIHASNTAGHLYVNDTVSNVTRLGIGLYGLKSGGAVDDQVKLKPVMSVTTVISGIKNIKEGDEVGYSRTYKAKKDITIATIPMGYFEGIDRRLSNKGFLKISDTFVPIVGRVSMNITTIDISKITDAKVGDRVEVISNVSDDKNSIDSFAKICNTISYEEVVHIPEHLKRVVE